MRHQVTQRYNGGAVGEAVGEAAGEAVNGAGEAVDVAGEAVDGAGGKLTRAEAQTTPSAVPRPFQSPELHLAAQPYHIAGEAAAQPPHCRRATTLQARHHIAAEAPHCS